MKFGAPQEGCFGQGVVFQNFISWFLRFLEILEFVVFWKGVSGIANGDFREGLFRNSWQAASFLRRYLFLQGNAY